MNFDEEKNPNKNPKKTKILCVLDGFGLTSQTDANPMYAAQLPVLRQVLSKYPWITLDADGNAVGQEEGLVGNSEVGHMNLGGLKMVPQLSYQITKSAETAFDRNVELAPDQLFDPKEFLAAVFSDTSFSTEESMNETQSTYIQAVDRSKTIHLIGLFSRGTIHSDLRHWVGAIEAAGKAGAQKIVMHLISDGRDSDRQSLVATWDFFVTEYENRLKPFEDKILLGSLGGRFYAMDRDNNHDRVARGVLPFLKTDLVFEASTGDDFAFTKGIALINKKFNINLSLTNDYTRIAGCEESFEDIVESLAVVTKRDYLREIFDEHISPRHLNSGISKNDTVWLINFRTDRCKQLAEMLITINREFDLNLVIMGMNDYGVSGVKPYQWSAGESIATDSYYPVFINRPVKNTLSDAIYARGESQLHIAETEKYNHVTYFFNGGTHSKNPMEDWVVIPSNKVNSHAQNPEMKVKEITDVVMQCIEADIDMRVCTEGDYDGFTHYVAEYWRAVETQWNNGLSVSEEDFAHTIEYYQGDSLRNSLTNNAAFWIYRGEQKVGLCRINCVEGSDELTVYDLYIFPAFQNQGIGTYIINYCKYLAQSYACTRIGLWVDSRNRGAQSFYEDLGFEKNDEQVFYWYNQAGERVHSSNAYRMICNLEDHLITPVKHYDYIIVNYANPDMVAHTGDFDATVVSLEALDTQLGRLIDAAQRGLCDIVITADHGNVERVGREHGGDGDIDTKHNANPVPCIFVTNSDIKTIPATIRQSMHYENGAVVMEALQETLTEGINRHINLTDQKSWLSAQDIAPTVIPLWYAGLCTLYIDGNV